MLKWNISKIYVKLFMEKNANTMLSKIKVKPFSIDNNFGTKL